MQLDLAAYKRSFLLQIIIVFFYLAYLETQDYNLIGVDWSENAKVNWYPFEIKGIRIVGRLVADLINVLIQQKLVSYENVHLIGHSAGAHVMGIAGANVIGGKVGRITGLYFILVPTKIFLLCPVLVKRGKIFKKPPFSPYPSPLENIPPPPKKNTSVLTS